MSEARFFTLMGNVKTHIIVGPVTTREEIIDFARDIPGKDGVSSYGAAIKALNSGDRIFYVFNIQTEVHDFMILAMMHNVTREAAQVARSVMTPMDITQRLICRGD